MPRNPFDLKFIVVVGKGGVGKSTMSASLALAHAAAGRRVLLAMCNSKERLSYMLGVEPIGHEIVEVAERVHAVNMEPGAALEEYGLMILKVRALYKLVFENRFVSAFLRGTPGMEAWAMLGKAQYHAFETRPDGSPRYDTVIVDAPATGHGLDLLRVPKVIVDVAPPGVGLIVARRRSRREYAAAGRVVVVEPSSGASGRGEPYPACDKTAHGGRHVVVRARPVRCARGGVGDGPRPIGRSQ